MDVRRRPLAGPSQLSYHQPSSPKASDALLLPLYLTNGIFFTLFFTIAYFLLHRWRDTIRNSTPLHILMLYELAGILCLIASFIYLLGFFGIDFVQSFISKPESDEEHQHFNVHDDRKIHCGLPTKPKQAVELPRDDEEVVERVLLGEIPSYSLESRLGDCLRAAKIQCEEVQQLTGKVINGMPLEGFDYESILGQCCEMPLGYVQIPMGIAGPLMLNGCEYLVPMAMTKRCLIASTNRGCKAIYASGDAMCVLLRDGMTRAPVVRFSSAKRASELKFFLGTGNGLKTF